MHMFQPPECGSPCSVSLRVGFPEAPHRLQPWPGCVGGCSESPSAPEVAGVMRMGGLSRLSHPSHPHWACPGEKPSSDTAEGAAIAPPTSRGLSDPSHPEPGPGRSSAPGPQHCWRYLRRSSGKADGSCSHGWCAESRDPGTFLPFTLRQVQVVLRGAECMSAGV